MTTTLPLEVLRSSFGDRLEERVLLAPFTSARVGGPADALIRADSASDLAEIAGQLWQIEVPFVVLGGGSNLLVSDAGVRGVVVLNRSRQVRFSPKARPPRVWAESGANFGALARQAAARSLGGLTWAAGIPGTVGGAVIGNAGAHGEDMAGNLMLAEILHRTRGHEVWDVERLEYAYRDSRLKRRPGRQVVLAATLKLEQGDRQALRKEMDTWVAFRRRTQPPGASMGSMFKNPSGDYAGRLIEAAGLKGTQIGDARISTRHANFFINLGDARAADILALMRAARNAVAESFGILLEPEIELLGEWSGDELE